MSGVVIAVSDSVDVSVSVYSDPGGGAPDPTPTPIPPPPPPTATSTQVLIFDVVTVPSDTYAVINWKTDVAAKGTISWGITQSYELGILSESTFDTEHITLLDGLLPNTLYYFRITALPLATNRTTGTYVGQFRTISIGEADVLNVSNFIAKYNSTTGAIDLSWRNPTTPNFGGVRLMRSTSFYPVNESDGELIYDGTAERIPDFDVEEGVLYYYTIFARNDDVPPRYSSGLVARERVPKRAVTPPPPTPTPEPTPEPEPVPIPPPTPEPFDVPPVVGDIDPIIEDFPLAYIEIIQGSSLLRFSGGVVQLNGIDPFTIRISYDRLPEVLKAIGVSIGSPRISSENFSFLLRVDPAKKYYTATVGALGEAGTYPLSVTILDFKNQGMKKITGSIVISRSAPLIVPSTIKQVTKTVTTFGTLVGVGSSVIQTMVLVSNVRSFYDVYLLLLKLIGGILGLLGLQKKRKPWGVVYDSVTKRPLDPAYLSIRSGGREVADAITDLDGRYGFLLPEGKYSVTATKTHYRFPSQITAGKTQDELYEHLYFGEEVQTKPGEIISRNIPLDPIGFDWNEFVKNKHNLFRLYSKREKIKSFIFGALFFIGFISALFSLFISPSVFNGILVVFYISVYSFQLFWRIRHRAISLLDGETREPLPFAIVRVYEPTTGQEVKAAVADELGRFYILVSPGKYYITVSAKAEDGSYRKVHQSNILNLKNGVLSSDIVVNEVGEQKVARRWA